MLRGSNLYFLALVVVGALIVRVGGGLEGNLAVSMIGAVMMFGAFVWQIYRMWRISRRIS